MRCIIQAARGNAIAWREMKLIKLLLVPRIKEGDTLGAIVDNRVSPLSTLYAWPVEGKANSRYL